MVKYIQRKFIDILITLIERVLYKTPVKPIDEERMLKFYANLWETPLFKEYCVDRETRFVHAQANEWSESQRGQRIENILLFTKAQNAWNKLHKERLDKEPGQGSSSKR